MRNRRKLKSGKMPFVRPLFYTVIAYMALCVVYLNFLTMEKNERLLASMMRAEINRELRSEDQTGSYVTKSKTEDVLPNHTIWDVNITFNNISSLPALDNAETKNIEFSTRNTTNKYDYKYKRWPSWQNIAALSQNNPKLPDGLSEMCVDIFRGRISNQSVEIERKRRINKLISDSAFIDLTKNCAHFRTVNKYAGEPLSSEEAKFPLAYAILMYKSVQQVEQLLRVIYRPHNYYCIHVDNKSSSEVHQAVQAITRCFDNVFIAPENVNVVYQSIRQVTAEIICMRELLARSKKWKYYINLTGQEFPLKTNLEIVQILKLYNGSNDMTTTGNLQSYRQDLIHIVEDSKLVRTLYRKEPPPNGLTIFKGEFHSMLSIDFVKFVLSKGMEIYDWFSDTQSPSEYFYPTLNRMPDAPGGFQGHSLYLARAKMWEHMRSPNLTTCYGNFVHGICVLSSFELPILLQQPHLFANKFYLDHDPLATDCLEELIRMRSSQPIDLNFSLYRQFVETRSFPECDFDLKTMRWWRMFYCPVRLAVLSDNYKWYRK